MMEIMILMGRRLTNLADSVDDSDAVTLKVLKEHTKDHSK